MKTIVYFPLVLALYLPESTVNGLQQLKPNLTISSNVVLFGHVVYLGCIIPDPPSKVYYIFYTSEKNYPNIWTENASLDLTVQSKHDNSPISCKVLHPTSGESLRSNTIRLNVVCPPNVYGTTCGYHCSCTASDNCNLHTTECPRGCVLGWLGKRCETRIQLTLTSSSVKVMENDNVTLTCQNSGHVSGLTYNFLKKGIAFRENASRTISFPATLEDNADFSCGLSGSSVRSQNITHLVVLPTCNCGIHECVPTKDEYMCKCLEGYKNKSPTICEDVNECQGNSNICFDNNVCVNKPGTFTCICVNPKQELAFGKICVDKFTIRLSSSHRKSKLYIPENPLVLVTHIGLSSLIISYLIYVIVMDVFEIVSSLVRAIITEPASDTDDEDAQHFGAKKENLSSHVPGLNKDPVSSMKKLHTTLRTLMASSKCFERSSTSSKHYPSSHRNPSKRDCRDLKSNPRSHDNLSEIDSRDSKYSAGYTSSSKVSTAAHLTRRISPSFSERATNQTRSRRSVESFSYINEEKVQDRKNN